MKNRAQAPSDGVWQGNRLQIRINADGPERQQEDRKGTFNINKEVLRLIGHSLAENSSEFAASSFLFWQVSCILNRQ